MSWPPDRKRPPTRSGYQAGPEWFCWALTLQAGKTAKGNPRYYFGRKLTGEPVEKLPAGYEVFESPERGQVYLRKERRTGITPIEREIVVEGIGKLSNTSQFIVDVEDDSLVVYLPRASVSEVSDMVRALAGPDALRVPRFQKARDLLVRKSRHEKIMRFELVDEEQRLYCVSRWCFRGSMDRWIVLAGPAPLSDLVEEYAEHLGQASFFELY